MLDLATTTADPADIDADLLVLAVGEGELERGELLDGTDARVGGVLRRAAGEERFRAKLGQTLVVHVRDVRAQRIALVGLGAGVDRAGQALRIAAGCAARIATAVGAPRVAFAWSLPPASASDGRACEVVAEGALLGSYRFDKYLTDDRGRRPATTTFILRPPVDAGAADSERAFARARSTARAVARARDLVNEPAGTLTPTALAEHRRGVGARGRTRPSRSSIAPAAPRWAWAFTSRSRRAARRSRASSISPGRRRARAGASSSSARESRSIRAACR